MKTLIALFSLMLCLAVYAATTGGSVPTNTAADASYEWSIERAASAFTADTIAGADSSTFLSLYNFQQGYEYILVTKPTTGTAGDSVGCDVRVDYYNGDKAFLYSTSVDSLVTSVGKAMMLPIGRTAYASYVTVKAIGAAALTGTQVIFPAGYLTVVKRRPVMKTKMWQ